MQTKKLAPGSVGVAPAALRFLYRVTLKRGWVPGDISMPKKPFKLPALLSPEEVTIFLASGRQPLSPRDPDDHLCAGSARLGGFKQPGATSPVSDNAAWFLLTSPFTIEFHSQSRRISTRLNCG